MPGGAGWGAGMREPGKPVVFSTIPRSRIWVFFRLILTQHIFCHCERSEAISDFLNKTHVSPVKPCHQTSQRETALSPLTPCSDNINWVGPVKWHGRTISFVLKNNPTSHPPLQSAAQWHSRHNRRAQLPPGLRLPGRLRHNSHSPGTPRRSPPAHPPHGLHR